MIAENLEADAFNKAFESIVFAIPKSKKSPANFEVFESVLDEAAAN